jgi:hypothetical protein
MFEARPCGSRTEWLLLRLTNDRDFNQADDPGLTE